MIFNRRRRRWLFRRLALLLLMVFVVIDAGLFITARWPQCLPEYTSRYVEDLSFQRVAEPGFDLEGQARLADSAWSMRYFEADGADTGYLYVGTDNNIVGLTLAVLRKKRRQEPVFPVRPPQIRRYRPDLGPATWEVVLDYAYYEQPPYLNQGFRSMEIYRAKADGRAYLYAGTMANESPSLWRSATGDPGSWEKVFTFSDDAKAKVGSVRGMTAHDDGLLYISTTQVGDIKPGGVGQIWATDGNTVTLVVDDGFGNPDNAGITALASFSGCLYAGSYNPANGYEVWKLRCVSEPDLPPQPVIQGGGGQPRNEAAMSLRTFEGWLYVGTGIPLGFNPVTGHGPRGCNVLRIDANDYWEVVVGKKRTQPVSDYRAGFGWRLNVYCWYMKVHADHLYLGTWDLSRTLVFLGEDIEGVAPTFEPLLEHLVMVPDEWTSPLGGDLYRTADGVQWEPVFMDGLGNPDNHGIRTLESTPLGLFVGTENPFTRLEVWLLPE